jgi:predicted transcriptional regulator YheO
MLNKLTFYFSIRIFSFITYTYPEKDLDMVKCIVRIEPQPVSQYQRKKMSKFEEKDDEQYALLKTIADGIAALFFPCVEVVIHNVRSGKVAYIANNLSRRKLGDDAGLGNQDIISLDKLTGPYEKLNWDGKNMRSISISTGTADNPGYLLCINLNTAIFEEARNALDMFLSVTRLQPQPEQLFKDDWQEKINTWLHEWLCQENTSLKSLSREQKKQLVVDLYRDGAFHAKNSPDYIAGVLSLGRTTIYKYLREIKEDSPT